MEEEGTRGQSGQENADAIRDVSAPSGWVTTKQAARSLGISPRTVRWHIEQGNIVAKSQGDGVQRTWLVSIDSLQAFRHVRRVSADMLGSSRTNTEDTAISADITDKPIRVLADRLAEEAARAAEYRVRLELTEQAQSTLESELAAERQRREEAERERDELRIGLESPPELQDAPETASEYTDRREAPPNTQEPTERRSWLYRFFFGP